MTDQEFLDITEEKLCFVMLNGCATDTHLGRKKVDPSSWAVTLRADDLSRLLDLAKEGVRK